MANLRGSPDGALAYVLDFNIVVSEFAFLSRFRADTLEKVMNSLIS